jgi:protein-S-isoprenylcysteine O-methyltransferase Ste14
MFRWIAGISMLATLCISGFYRYRARLATGTIPRRAEPTPLIVGRALVAVPLFGAVVSYLIRPAWVAWGILPLPLWSQPLGATLCVLSVPSALWVFRSIGTNVSETALTKPGHALVTHGPYRWIRHPLYATGGLLLFGVALVASNGFILCLATLALVLIRLVVIPREEAALAVRFGARYRDYVKTTGALLPRLWSVR